MGDMGGCELGMCKEVSWEEVVEVLNSLRRKAPGPDGILNEMVMYGGGRVGGRVGGSDAAAGDKFGIEE